LAVLAVPVFDSAAAIIRRRLTGRSIYAVDRAHLHHVLLQRGLLAGCWPWWD
jgi:UDP-GlcNAc:undecaprenyl-phosphate GlcNAc-1-phosphate transferase